MHFDARRLAGDEQPGGRSQPQDGTWLVRERRATRRLNADTAGPDAPSQRREPGNRMSVRHILNRDSAGHITKAPRIPIALLRMSGYVYDTL
jgi:hypothetical protein